MNKLKGQFDTMTRIMVIGSLLEAVGSTTMSSWQNL